jgi:hypothetical protein
MIRRGLVIGLFCVFAAPLLAGPMNAEYDFAAKVGLLKSYFRDYNQQGQKAIYFEAEGVHFWLGTPMKEPKQVGLHSPLKLIGDFDITVQYEWLSDVAPTTGYGLSCGIAVEHQGQTISIARGCQIKGRNLYVVTLGKPTKEGPKFGNGKEKETRAKTGRLALRREKDEVLCLVADGTDTLEELDRIKFTKASIHQVRLFADPGNSPTLVDARLTQIRFRAEEIQSDIPESERSSTWLWWLAASLLVLGVAALVGIWWWRRRAADS